MKNFKSWLLSYFSILLLPIIISVITFFHIDGILETKLNDINLGILYELQRDLENELFDIVRIVTQISLEKVVQNGSTVNDMGIAEKNDFTKSLRTHQLNNSNLEFLYFYNRESDTVLTNEGSIDLTSLYHYKFYDYGISAEEFKQFQTEPHTNDFKILHASTDYRQNNKVMYVQSVPMGPINNFEGHIGAFINKEFITRNARNLSDILKGKLLILNNEGEIFYSDEDTEFIVGDKHLAGAEGNFYSKVNGSEYIISYVTSPVLEMKYVFLIPSSVYWRELFAVRSRVVLILLGCLLIGGFLVWKLLNKNYRPINEMVQKIITSNEIMPSAVEDEFGLVDSVISSLRKDKGGLEFIIEKGRKAMRPHILSRIAVGNFSDDELPSMLTQAQLSFEWDEFLTVVFFNDDSSELFKNEKDLSEAEKSNVIEFLIDNVAENIFEEKGMTCSAAAILDSVVGVVNSPGGGYDAVVETVSEIRSFFAKELGVHLSAAVGGFYSGVNNAFKSYNEAMAAAEYKFIMGKGNVIAYRDISGRKDENSFVHGERNKIINFINLGQYDKLEAYLDSVFCENEMKEISIHAAKCFTYDMISIVLSIFNGGDGGQRESLLNLLTCETVDGILVQIKSVLKDLCEPTEQKADYCTKIIDIIAENYWDYSLNVESIGARLKMSPSYLSRMFREGTGRALPEYINHTRIERAKELLIGTDDSVAAVAEKVGFAGSDVFIRTFKKYEGVTPGQFKHSNPD